MKTMIVLISEVRLSEATEDFLVIVINNCLELLNYFLETRRIFKDNKGGIILVTI